MAKVFDILKGVAPTLAGAFAGTFGGPAMGLAVKQLGEKLLGKSDASHSDVAAALVSAKPEQLLELRRLDTSFKQAMLDYGYKVEELEVRDRDSARERDKAFVVAGRSNIRADVLAYLAIGGLLGLSVLVFYVELSPHQREILIYILGALTVLVKDVYGFEFGSSKDAAKSMNAMKEWLDQE